MKFVKFTVYRKGNVSKVFGDYNVFRMFMSNNKVKFEVKNGVDIPDIIFNKIKRAIRNDPSEYNISNGDAFEMSISNGISMKRIERVYFDLD